MSEIVIDNHKPVSSSESNHPSDLPSNEKSKAIPYLERIRTYYNRRMPTNRTVAKPHTEVEMIPKPSQGKPETEQGDDDDRETVNAPYPGVDDGFFPDNKHNNNNPDAENIPLVPHQPGSVNPSDGGEDQPGNNPEPGEDEPDIGRPNFPGGNFPYYPNYPEKPASFPGGRPDIESGIPEPLPDINVYQHKKTLAQGMMDLALFSANANQLRYVLESYDRHPYYYPSIILISFSLIFQVGVGIGLIWNAHYDVKDEREICIANRLNNYTVIGIFLITVINVFISAFGVANITPTNP